MKLVQSGLLLLFSGVAFGQAVPAGDAPSVGFQLPTVGGTLHYSVNLSESISKGLYTGSSVGAATNISGNVGLITSSQRHPFSMIYSGGYSFGNQNQPSAFFQSLSFSQVLTAGRWNFLVGDSINYLPQTGTVGLSGIPGVGDLGVDPVVGGVDPSLGILTFYGPRVNNSLTVTASRPLSARISFQASGILTTLRYLGGNSQAVEGLNNTSESGTAGLSYRIDARSSVNAGYSYSRYSFNGTSFITQGVNGGYNRQFTRRLTGYVSAGPQFSTNSDGLTPTATSLGMGAGLSYAAKTFSTSLNYSQGVSTGYGVIAGATSKSLTGSVHRNFGRTVSASGVLGYSQSKSLQSLTGTSFSSDAGTASGQVSKSLGRYFSTFASYTIQDQRVATTIGTTNAFDGIYQVFGFGLSYSPSSINLGRR